MFSVHVEDIGFDMLSVFFKDFSLPKKEHLRNLPSFYLFLHVFEPLSYFLVCEEI